MDLQFQVHNPDTFASLEGLLVNEALTYNEAIAGFVEGEIPETWSIVWYYREGRFARLSPSLHPGVHYHYAGGEGDEGLLFCLRELGHLLMHGEAVCVDRIKDCSLQLLVETPLRFLKFYSKATATILRKRRELLQEVYPNGFSSMEPEQNAQRRSSAEELKSSCNRCQENSDYSNCERGCSAVARYCMAQ